MVPKMDNRHAALHHANIVRLGHRDAAPVAGLEEIGIMDPIMNIAVPNRVVEARADTTSSSSTSTSTCGTNACEKPVSNSTFTVPIALGVIVPVIGAAILFIYLHRRHVRKQREEDANDRHASMDFGLGDVPQPGRPKRGKGNPGVPEMQFGDEKVHQSRRQVSMDMTMNSPYLLPPELHNSRESLHSLSRTIQQEDPYRPIAQYTAGDASSIRSQSKQGSSIYTGSSKTPSRLQDLGTAELLSNAGPMPRSNPPTAFVPPPRQNSLPQGNKSTSPVDLSGAPTPPPPYPLPAKPSQAHLADPMQRTGLPSNPRPGQNLAPQLPALGDRDSFLSNGDTADLRKSNNYLGAFIHESEDPPTTPSPPTKSIERNAEARKSPPPAINSLPSNPRPPRKESITIVQPQAATFFDQGSEYGDGFKVTPPSPGRGNNADVARGQRYSMDVPPEEFVQAGLGAPGFDARRLSMGFRPLPPDTATEHDDPEIRANRIRSFYKEYFDDSKPQPQGQYYEDYDENYLGETTYYDPDSNAFVMPYAEPVTRRAMTPPPTGARGPPRFQGPPRPRNGSMGAMSAMSARGMRGPQMYPSGPFPQGPRAYSSASGRIGNRAPKRPLPPPAPLNTLPTPSKLKDDSFSLMNSLEFAPPQTYRDRVAGRSESPLGERRPYSPALPSFAPIASSFDELAPMPSPHLLRKSGTFTALDFAPPKRFRDADNMSDAGSIRSNRSGVSAMHNQAIRNGAYRISKIPTDVVFTKDNLASTLKPQWGMRAGN